MYIKMEFLKCQVARSQVLSYFLIVCFLNYSYPSQQLQLCHYQQRLGRKSHSLKKFCSLGHRLF